MSVKREGQLSFAEALLPAGAGSNGQLERLNGLVKWYRFEKVVGHLRDEGGPGRPGYGALLLFKAVLLGSLYGLSERELEEALNDRLSFKRFVGLGLEEASPDHSVLNRYRNRLRELATEQEWARFRAEHQTRMMARARERGAALDPPLYGQQIMTDRECTRLREQLREADTEQERERIRAEHRTRMQERARELGIPVAELG